MSQQKLLITGGAQRANAVWMHESRHYDQAVLIELDVQTGEARTLLTYKSPPEACPEDRPSIIFKSASLHDGRLYLCTQTEVLIYDWPSLDQVAYHSLPCFNDVHHVLPVGEHLYVASTGLDLVVVLDAAGNVVAEHNALGKDPWHRFDKGTDYRKIPTTKPHESHPNFVFLVDGQPWVTRFEQRDAACLSNLERRVDVGIERVHDGNPHGDRLWLTTVDGHLVAGPTSGGRIDRDIDLNRISGDDGRPLGWCRGLHLDGATAYVGFSRIRSTPLRQNLAWLKRFKRPAEFRPTRIGVYDVEAERHVRDLDLEPAGLSAVFSILPVSS